MDKDVMIRVEGVSKRYTLGRNQGAGGYTALRDVLSDRVRRLWRKRNLEAGLAADTTDFWALRDVTFEVRRGEVVGIIGRNGAGKSTLLKILSRITEPTIGRIRLKGRVASLLEVGTGFHPELTGRENIFLNGAILGMHRSEITAKFDEIVAFAEVDRFLDTPVKRYSSGMYVRLAFAVAAHLEPEILIVDEVLAVGDAGFQKKCLGKMQDVSEKEGRTVLFVSHQLSAIEHFCTRGIVLQSGQIVFDGKTLDATRSYLGLTEQLSNGIQSLEHRTDRKGAGAVRFSSVELRDVDGGLINNAVSGEMLRVRLHYRKYSDLNRLRGGRFSVAIMARGYVVFNCSTELVTDTEWILEANGAVDCVIKKLPLSPGVYQIGVYMEASGQTQDWIEEAVPLHIEGGSFYPYAKQISPGHEGMTYALVEHSWSMVPVT